MKSIHLAIVHRTVSAVLLALVSAPLQAELFVTRSGNPTVQSYHTFTGVVRNGSFVSGLSNTGGCLATERYLFVSEGTGIKRFDALSGAPVGGTVISGLDGGYHMVASGNDLYVANYAGGIAGAGSIGKYTLDGVVQNPALITGLNGPYYLAVSDTDLYVGSWTTGTIGRYTTSGGVVDATFITGLSLPTGIAVNGNKLYVNSAANQVKLYDAQTGTLISGSFISGLNSPLPLALYKGRLYVGNSTGGTVAVYDANSGALIDAALISGVGGIAGLAIRPVATPTVKIGGPKLVKVPGNSHLLKGNGTETEFVRVKVGRGVYQAARVRGNRWSFRARIQPGRNRVLVQAVNSEGVRSRIATVTVIR